MELSDKRTIFDRPLMDLLKPSWEKAFYLVILMIAVATRFWDLGARALSHDESLHALYSFYLYNGTGYQHNPMMHGPFLFHANALIYFLFGVTDYTCSHRAGHLWRCPGLSPVAVQALVGQGGRGAYLGPAADLAGRPVPLPLHPR